jgi:hypothetical protein
LTDLLQFHKQPVVAGKERRHLVPNWNKTFTVAVVTRGDLTEVGLSPEQIDSLTDADMQAIAEKMADLYAGNSYWQDLQEAVRRLLSQRHQDNRTTGGIYG